MVVMLAIATMLALGACGPGLPSEEPKVAGGNAMEHASGDEHAIRALMTGSLTYAGLWFQDPACTTRFPVASTVKGPGLDSLAHCLAELHWHQSMRTDPLADVVVLTYGPGMEIEARLVPDPAGPRLVWIGFVSRRDEPTGLPSVEPEVLEALRTAGSKEGPLDPAVAPTLELDEDTDHQAYAWFDVCLDTTGQVTGAHIRSYSSPKAAHAFADAIARWKFQPYTIAGHALPVCSLVRLAYPPDKDDHHALPLPLPPSATRGLPEPPPIVPPRAVEEHRIAGERAIEPDARTKTFIQINSFGRVVGTFRLCLDATGKPEAIDVLRSTGIASYDQRLIDGMSAWRYSPFELDGKPTPVCTGITFIYTQH